MQPGNTDYIYKACFQHDMAYGKCSNYLTKRTHSEKDLRDEAFKIASNPKSDGYQRGLAYNFFDKMFLFVCLLSLFQVGIKNSIKTNKKQPSSSCKKQPRPSHKEICKLTDYDLFLYELGIPWCANYK